MEQAKKQLDFLRREPDSTLRHGLYGHYLLEACREQNVFKIRVMYDLLWEPVHFTTVERMMKCMQLYIDTNPSSRLEGENEEPACYRAYLDELDDAFDEANEMDDIQLKEGMADMDCHMEEE